MDKPSRRSRTARLHMTQQAAAPSPQPSRAPWRRHRVHLDIAPHDRELEQASRRRHPTIDRRRRRTPPFAQPDHPPRHPTRPRLPLQPIEHIRRDQLAPPKTDTVEKPVQAHQVIRVAANRRRRELADLKMTQPQVADLDQPRDASQPANPVPTGHQLAIDDSSKPESPPTRPTPSGPPGQSRLPADRGSINGEPARLHVGERDVADGAAPERGDSFVEPLTDARHLGLGDPGVDAHSGDEVVDRTRGQPLT